MIILDKTPHVSDWMRRLFEGDVYWFKWNPALRTMVGFFHCHNVPNVDIVPCSNYQRDLWFNTVAKERDMFVSSRV